MNLIFNLFILLCIVKIGYGLPVKKIPENYIDPEETDGYFEGDMELDENQKLTLNSLTRNGLIDEKYRWPQRQVFYKIGDIFDNPHKDYIKAGMGIIESETCIKFIEASDTATAYINITGTDTGCHSTVGYRNNVQRVNLQVFPLDSGCFRMGSIEHELLHALGFYHQQSSYDRDEYIQIQEENIIEGKEFNFQKYSNNLITDFDIKYDYESVMHYSPYAFSKNGEKTIVPLENFEIGQRNGLSIKDIQKIKLMYKCPFYT